MKRTVYVMPAGKLTLTGTRAHILKSLTTAAASQIAQQLRCGRAGKQFGDARPDTTLIAWHGLGLHDIEYCANNTDSRVITIGEA